MTAMYIICLVIAALGGFGAIAAKQEERAGYTMLFAVACVMGALTYIGGMGAIA